MKHLLKKLKELEERKFDVVMSRGPLALHQTQRNKAIRNYRSTLSRP